VGQKRIGAHKFLIPKQGHLVGTIRLPRGNPRITCGNPEMPMVPFKLSARKPLVNLGSELWLLNVNTGFLLGIPGNPMDSCFCKWL